MQPEVAACETTSFPSTTSALTDDAPHMQGAWSCLAPLACADLNASTARATAITKQALTRGRRPQNLTTRGCRAASPSTMGRLAHLRPRRVLSSMRSSQTFPSPRRGPAYREAAQTLKAMAETATRRRGPTAPIPLVAAGRRLSRFCRVSTTRRKKVPVRRSGRRSRAGLPP